MWGEQTPSWIAFVSSLHSDQSASGEDRFDQGQRAIAVPRFVHQIWLGGDVPGRLSRLSRTWSSQVWRDEHAARMSEALFTGGDILRALPNFGAMSDVLRYEILYAVGGVYADMDEQCVGDIHSLGHHPFWAGVSHTPHAWELNQAVLGACPGHPLLLACLAECHSTEPPGRDASAMDTIRWSGPGMFTRVIMSCLCEAVERGVALGAVVRDRVPGEVAHKIYSKACGLREKVLAMVDEEGRAELASYPFPPSLDASFTFLPSPVPRAAWICPKHVLYPIPNTLACAPPAWTGGGEEEYARLYEARQPTTTLAWKRAVVPPEAAPWMREGTLAVHYWARTWQRARPGTA